jgi:hypothetical protein
MPPGANRSRGEKWTAWPIWTAGKNVRYFSTAYHILVLPIDKLACLSQCFLKGDTLQIETLAWTPNYDRTVRIASTQATTLHRDDTFAVRRSG